MIRIIKALSSRRPCRSLLKRLCMLPVPCEYISISLIMYTVNDLDHFDTNSDLHGMNTRAKYQLHRPTVNLSCIEQDILYSSIKTLNNLPPVYFEIKTGDIKTECSMKRVSHCSYPLFYRWVSLHQSNHFPSSTSTISPTIIINDSS